MIKKVHLPLVMLMILSIMLGACATPATTSTAVPPTTAPATPTTPPEPTATVEPAPDVAALFKALVDGLPADKGYAVVSATKLNEELVDKPPFLLDVREDAEIEKEGYIAGSVDIPIRDLLKNLDK